MSTFAPVERLEISIDGKAHATLTALFETHFRLIRLAIRRDFEKAYSVLEEQAASGDNRDINLNRQAFEKWADASLGMSNPETYIGSYTKILWAQQMVKEPSSDVPTKVFDWLEAVAELPQRDLLESFYDWEKTLPKVLVKSDTTRNLGIEGSPSWSANKVGPESKWQLQFESGKLQQLVTDCCAATEIFAQKWKRSNELITRGEGLKDFSVDNLVPALESLLNGYDRACSQRVQLPGCNASSLYGEDSAASQGSATVVSDLPFDQKSGSTVNAPSEVKSDKESMAPTFQTLIFSSMR